MLAISIHRDHGVTRRGVDARTERGLMTEVASEMNDGDSGVRYRVE
jgi:hypothetical protein